MTTPAGWIRYYYEMRDSIGAPALDFIDSVGRVYAEFCAHCNFQKRHCNSMGQWVCGHCGEPWSYNDVAVFKGEVDRPMRPTAFDHRLGRMFDLGRLLMMFIDDRLYGRDARLYVAQVVLGMPPRELAIEVPKAWPNFPKVHKQTIWRHLKRGAEEWERRIKLARIPTDAG